MSVLLGNGDGTFQAAQNYSVSGPRALGVGDAACDDTLPFATEAPSGPAAILSEPSNLHPALASVKPKIAACGRAHKAFLAYEYGWDRTNFPTVAALRSFLGRLRANPGVAGDAFWALQAHADGHGWMPIPADVADPSAAARVESGEWWALYYPGVTTLVTTAADMAARAQVLRRHNYAMRGLPVPAHAVPPAPTVTSAVYGPTGSAHVYWQGSAGAGNYTVQRALAAGGPWLTVCRRCVTDRSDGFVDDTAAKASWYRVVPYNLDGKPGAASRPRQASAS